MRKHLTVAGVDLATFGVYISGNGTFGSPAKDITAYTVPGRNGLVLNTRERLENLDVSYPCFIYTNFEANMRALRSYLLSLKGYVKIEDDYDATHFRLGFFEDAIKPDMLPTLDAGEFTLTFNCRPERWLTSGEEVITSTSQFLQIANPTRFPSKPIVRIYNSSGQQLACDIYPYSNPNYAAKLGAQVLVASSVWTEFPSLAYVEFDSETNSCYTDTGANLNKYTEVTQHNASVYGVDMPKIYPGSNNCWKVQASKIEIVPRWWEV